MDDQKTIIALLMVIIAVLVVGVVVFSPLMAKEDSNIAIAESKLSVGESMVVKLTDNSGNPIPGGKITVKITDGNGNAVEDEITTNSKGNAKLKMQEKGTYSVECSFGGNDKFASSSIIGNLSVKKATTKVLGEKQTSTVVHSSKYAPNGGMYPEYGPEVDAQGITREYAIAHDMHYIEMEVDGDRPGETVTVGGYTAIDPQNGLYHT